MSKTTKKEIDNLYEQQEKRYLDYRRKDNPEREAELLERFGETRLETLRDDLDLIQNNCCVNFLYNDKNPLLVTPEELVFLEEEDKLQKRFFVDFSLSKFNKDTKSFDHQWVRQPFQTNTQVKRTLEWIFKTNQKVKNLSIIDENDLDEEVNCLMKDGSYKHFPLRVVRFDERYSWKKMPWSWKIRMTHDVCLKVVTQKEVTSYMNRIKERRKEMGVK